MAAISRTSSPSPSEFSSPSSAHDGSPTTFTIAAVLFKGPPLSIFRSVASYIASQLLLSPPSPLKVLEGALIEMEKSNLSTTTSLESKITSLKHTGASSCRISYYKACTDHVPGRRWDHRFWDTIEVDKVTHSSAPTRLLSLFDGMVGVFVEELEGSQQQLQRIFELFGGKIVTEISTTVTHVVGLKPAYTTNRAYLNRNGDVGCLAIHPTWVTSSIMHGFLLPTSLFSLDSDNPLFQDQVGYTRLPAFLKAGVRQKAAQILSEPTEFCVPSPPTLPLVEPLPCFLNRRIFFEPEGPHLQLVRAVSSVVSRLGGQIVSDLRVCDWVVTGERSGASYLYGTRHPEIIMGTLEHIIAHIDFEGDEPIDPRSNLLHYPGPVRAPGKRHDLITKSVYISKRYPSEVHRYLSTLAFLMMGRPPLSSGHHINAYHTVIIAPSSQPYEADCLPDTKGDLIFLLPKFLEDSYLHFDSPLLFDFDTNSFRDPKFECFSPKKLPKNFHLAEHKGERISDEMVRKWCDLETRWEMHEESTRTCECLNCRCLLV